MKKFKPRPQRPASAARRASRAAALLAAAAGAASLLAGAARAQVFDRYSSPEIPGAAEAPGVTVASRLRDDYAPLGVRLGSFMLRPELDVLTGYDDNVLGRRNGAGSVLEETKASLDLRSNWSIDSLGASLSVDDTRYFDQPRQSETNWSAGFGASRQLGRDVVSINYTHLNLNETPRDLGTPLLDRTIAYRVDDVRLGYAAAFNRLTVRPDLDVALYDFDDGSIAGVPYLQSYRNRRVITPGVTFGYELAPRRNLVAVVRNAVADYDSRAPGGVFRNYNDTSALVGIDYDEDGLWRYRALAGYEVRTFSASVFKTISAPVIELTAIYTPTGLTTLTGTASRRIEDSADERTTGFTETALKLTVDHEYLRNVLLQARGGLYIDEYAQGGSSQTLYTAGAKVEWLLDRNLRLSASYDFTARGGSSIAATAVVPGQVQSLGGGYVENRFLVQLTFRL